MGEEGLFLLPVVNHNRDLISKKEDRHESPPTSTISKFDRGINPLLHPWRVYD